MKLPHRVRGLLPRFKFLGLRVFWITMSSSVLVIEIGLSIVFWDWLNGGETASTTIRNIGFIIAGSVALPLAIWRGLVADKQASAAREQADTALQQAAIAQRGLLSERYQRGAEMLGSEALSVRQGGIYTLQRLVEKYGDSYHVEVMRLLCAFVRHPTADKSYEAKLAEQNSDPQKRSSPRDDVQAAVNWIVSCDRKLVGLEENEGFELNLIGAEFAYGQIAHGDLSGAILSHANLSDTTIFNVALTHAYLRSVVLQNAEFSRVDFTGAKAWGVNLSSARMFHIKMPGFSLDYANVDSARLYDVVLSNASIQHANLSRVEIKDSDLSDTFFLDSNLSNAQILRSDLSGSTILRTDMSGATLHDTNLSGTYFYDPDGGTATSPVTGLTQAQLDQACADSDNPPKLDHVLDAETGKPLVWNPRATR